MRCPKCGYISFDYLKQCSQCQADLTAESRRLNLPDIRPNPISIQEIKERAHSQKKGRDHQPEDQMTQIAKGLKKVLDSGSFPKENPASDRNARHSLPGKPVIEISMEDIDLDAPAVRDKKPV
jgi:hypothetical protein